MTNKILKNIDLATPLSLGALVTYQEGQIVSRTLVQNRCVSLTLFAFDTNEEISSHESKGDAMVQVLDGKATDGLLDTYQPERRPHVRDIIEMSMFLGKIICIPDPVKAAERDEAFFTGKVPPPAPFPCLTDGILRRDASGSVVAPAGLLRSRSRQFRDPVGAVSTCAPRSVLMDAPPWLTQVQPVDGGFTRRMIGPQFCHSPSIHLE